MIRENHIQRNLWIIVAVIILAVILGTKSFGQNINPTFKSVKVDSIRAREDTIWLSDQQGGIAYLLTRNDSLVFGDASGEKYLALLATGGPPGGSPGAIQYNNAGNFGGAPMTTNGTDITVTGNTTGNSATFGSGADTTRIDNNGVNTQSTGTKYAIKSLGKIENIFVNGTTGAHLKIGDATFHFPTIDLYSYNTLGYSRINQNVGILTLRSSNIANTNFSYLYFNNDSAFFTTDIGTIASFRDDHVKIFKPINLPQVSATTTDGDLLYETGQDKLYGYSNGIAGWYDKAIFSQYAAVTRTGVVSAVSLIDNTNKIGTTTLPANFFKPGKALRYRLVGYYTTDASPGNATVTINIGGTTFRTTGSFALDNSVTNGYWQIEGAITCYTSGVTGTLSGMISWNHVITDGAGFPMHHQPTTTVTPVTFNTTQAGQFDVLWTADDAGTSITTTTVRLWEIF